MNNKNTKFLVSLLITLALTMAMFATSNALAVDELPSPSDTVSATPTPTDTVSPTPTPTETPSPTPIPCPTSAPLITVDPFNLILNPGLEEPNCPDPAHWHRGFNGTVWGENVLTYTYPVVGETGYGAKVEITEYVGGDAKWYFDDVALTPGLDYTFSDSYLSNVQTAVVARYKTGSDSYAYVDFGKDLPASTSWQKFTHAFTAPVDAISLSVFHVISRVGALTIDNASLTVSTPTPTPTPTPTETPSPTPTPTPVPGAVAILGGGGGSNPTPTPTPSITPTSTPNTGGLITTPTPSSLPKLTGSVTGGTPTPTPSSEVTATEDTNTTNLLATIGGWLHLSWWIWLILLLIIIALIYYFSRKSNKTK